MKLGEVSAARLELAREAALLREQGLTLPQIGERLGCSRSYASGLICDPDGAKARARKDSYRGKCERCGDATTGCYGRKKHSRLCATCAAIPTAKHGTRSRYSRGCGCDACRKAHREFMRTLKQKPVPNHGTVSGYRNYGCRCAACREAHSVYQWMRPEYKRRWAQKKKAAA